MAHRAIAVAELAPMLGSAVIAAPPAPAPTSFTPEAAYCYRGRDSFDIRLSNATGTAAVLVYRSASLNGLDLGAASQRIIA